jgi:protein ImuA
MHESSRLHPALKRALASSAPHAPDKGALRPLGAEAVDRVLDGGLAAGACHEVFAREEGGGASATGFAVMLALRLMRAPEGETCPQTMLWLREEKVQRKAGLNGPGLADLGFDPARLILGVLPDARALLRASVDALRCVGALGVVLLEMADNPALLNLTASRRLALAAEASGVTLLLLRTGHARPAPSAARTRWEIGPAPSLWLEADAPGNPMLAVTLLRQRGGPAGLDWTLEWDRDAGLFRPAALPGARLPVSGGGPVPLVGAADEPWRLTG